MKSKGHTLVEFIIVVAIIGILAAIAIPNFIKYQCVVRANQAGIEKETAQMLCKECSGECNGMTSMEVIGRVAGGQTLATILGKDFEADEVETPETCANEKVKVKQLTDKISDLERQLNQYRVPIKQDIPINNSWKQ